MTDETKNDEAKDRKSKAKFEVPEGQIWHVSTQENRNGGDVTEPVALKAGDALDAHLNIEQGQQITIRREEAPVE